jgi:Tol biopolymer transport system component
MEFANPEFLAGGDSYAARWSPDGKWIYYFKVGKKSTNVWTVAVDGRAERPVTDLRGRRGSPGLTSGPLATDGAYLYFTWQEDLGDLFVADVTYPGLWQ